MADVAARLKAARERLVSSGPEPGRAWCREWTDEVDAAVTELMTAVSGPGRLLAVAVGGYGRSELCPASDLDLLLLAEGRDEDDLAAVVKDVIYPLWDAGCKVGYAVRDPKQAVAAVDDVDIATALLDARPIAGDRMLLRTVRDRALQRLRRRPARFLTALADADANRRARAGDAAEVLEPDLKSGAGGLRDVQSLRWSAGVLVGEVGLDPLVSAGYLGAPDRARLSRAYDRLLAERCALHLEAGRAQDVLRLDLQQAVAERLGERDGADDRDTAAHRLLTGHFLAARDIDHVHRRAWTLMMADAQRGRRLRRPAQSVVDGFEVVDGVLRLPAQVELVDASLPIRLLAALIDTAAVLDRGTAAGLARAVAAREDALAWTDDARAGFVASLWRGRAALPALAELDDVGLLGAMIPEWLPMRGRTQRNPFHRYSLDRHAVHAAAELAETVAAHEWAAEMAAVVEDRETLMLGVLLHDIGKAYGEPHSRTGIPVAQAVMRRLGASESAQQLVGRLVEHHLLLPDMATKRDIADPALAIAVADEVGDHATLGALYLLAAADGVATGPSAWNTWKSTLVHSLVTKVAAVLDETHPDDVGDGAVTTAEDAMGAAVGMGVEPAVVRAHLDRLPEHYAASVSARAVVRHAALGLAPLGPAEVRTRMTPGEARKDGHDVHDELDVIALDSPGLFAKVAGVLALHGGSVLEAHAYSREDGVAVDTFAVQRPEGVTGSWWAAVEGDIDEAVAGRLALRARVARKAATQRRKLARAPQIATTVAAVEDVSGGATVVEVHTLDRTGVLFALVTALAELELDIVVAKIQTMGHEVVDVFYVRDAAGATLDDDHVAELELAIRGELDRLD